MSGQTVSDKCKLDKFSNDTKCQETNLINVHIESKKQNVYNTGYQRVLFYNTIIEKHSVNLSEYKSLQINVRYIIIMQ